MEQEKTKNIIEAVLLSAEKPMTVVYLDALFEGDNERPTRDEIRQVLHDLAEDYENRGLELKQVASGFRLQVRQDYADWVGRLWEEKPTRYSRALLETLALIAYRQPITRGEIEEVRGVSVSTNIIKTCLERDWIKVLGHKDVPGRPSLYGTTREFLDYFNLKTLDELPALAEITNLDDIHPELALGDELQENGDTDVQQDVTDIQQDDVDASSEEQVDVVAEAGDAIESDSEVEADIEIMLDAIGDEELDAMDDEDLDVMDGEQEVISLEEIDEDDERVEDSVADTVSM